MEWEEAITHLLMWVPGKTPSSATSALAKTPLLRDVPGVKKRLTKRESIVSPSRLDPFGSSSPWLKERSSRSHLGGLAADTDPADFPQAIIGADGTDTKTTSGGTWKRVLAVLKSHGVLSLYSDDKALLHTTLVSDLAASEVRRVDDSIFLRPDVISVSCRVSTLARAANSGVTSTVVAAKAKGRARSSSKSSTIGHPISTVPGRNRKVSVKDSASTATLVSSAECIYLAFPNRSKMLQWLIALKAFAVPEIYKIRHKSTQDSPFAPKSPSSLAPGSSSPSGELHEAGSDEASITTAAPSPTEQTSLHRIHRAVHVQIIEARPVQAAVEPTWASMSKSSWMGSSPHRGKSLSSLARKSVSAASASDDRRSSKSSAKSDPPGALDTSSPSRRKSLISTATNASPSGPSYKLRGMMSEANMASIADLGAKMSPSHSVASELTPSASSVTTVLSAPIDLAASDDGEPDESGPIAGLGSGSSSAHWTTPSSPPSSTMSPSRKDSNTSSAVSLTSPLESGFVGCRIYINGSMMARTSFKSSQDSLIWVEKFDLDTLPPLRRMQVEVVQQIRSAKQSPLGIVSIPVETIARGEVIEGWFPIWSMPDTDDATRDMANYGQEAVGELKLVLKLSTDVVLPLPRYAAIEKALTNSERALIIQHLASLPGQDSLLSLIVKLGTANDTIVPLLIDLAHRESASLGNDPDKDLLFRGNTALSRSLDKYQQLSCTNWLNAAIGAFIRQIVDDETGIDVEELLQWNQPKRLELGARAHTPQPPPPCLETFAVYVNQIWESLYQHRHQCPTHLQEILQQLRTSVNARFSSGASGSGIQGVGAFVFLRLICPALTSPQLFGLVQLPPSPSASKLLLLIAKVFLALANKKTGFDTEKEPVLSSFNGFLREQSSTYDDLITFVSTAGSSASLKRDDDELILDAIFRERRGKLLSAHADALPTTQHDLDRPLILSRLVSEVARLGVQPDSFAFAGMQGFVSPIVSDFIHLCEELDLYAQTLLQLTDLGYCSGPISSTAQDISSFMASASSVSRASGVATPRNGRFFSRSRSATVTGAGATPELVPPPPESPRLSTEFDDGRKKKWWKM